MFLKNSKKEIYGTGTMPVMGRIKYIRTLLRGESHHDDRAGVFVPARPTTGEANYHGGAAVSGRGIHPKGGGYRLGGAQASPHICQWLIDATWDDTPDATN